ncbi:MAG: hypothetical protein ACC628_26850 [Pirellulaceae bacterium]
MTSLRPGRDPDPYSSQNKWENFCTDAEKAGQVRLSEWNRRYVHPIGQKESNGWGKSEETRHAQWTAETVTFGLRARREHPSFTSAVSNIHAERLRAGVAVEDITRDDPTHTRIV